MLRRAEMMFMPVASQLEYKNSPEDSNGAKALFMAVVASLVEAGRGELVRLECGTLELRLTSGKIYYLDEQSITRIA